MMSEKRVHEAKIMAIYNDLEKIEDIAEKSIRQGRFSQRNAILAFVYADNAKTKLKDVT